MDPIRVRLFGQFQVQCGAEVLTGCFPPKLQELFCYILLFRDDAHRRETLASLLWPNSTTPHSKKNLRQALWQLQSLSALGDILRKDGDVAVQVDKRAESKVDSALAAAGFGFQPAHGFNPEGCADTVRLSVGSPRLDSVISRAYHIGRAEAKKAVVRGFVAVNLRLG